MRLSRRPTEGRPVGSKRRLGRPAALLANPPAPAPSSLPATARPSSQPPRENHRSLLPPPLPPRAGYAFPRSRPERLGPERPPSLRPHPHRRGGRETCPPPFPAPAASSADFLRPNPAPASPLPARDPARSRPDRSRDSGRPPFPAGPSLPARSGRRDRPPGGSPAHRRGRLPHPGRGDRWPGETLPTAVLPGRPFCPRPAARPRALPASGRPFRRQRDAFILWRPNGSRMSRSAEGAVGSIRRLGRPAALPTNPLAPARLSLPATTRPSRRPPKESLRSLLLPPFPPRAGCAFPHSRPERLRPEETALPSPATSPARPTEYLPASISSPGRPFRQLPAAGVRSRGPTARQVCPALPTLSPQDFRPPSLPARALPSGPLRWRDRPSGGPPAHRRGRPPPSRPGRPAAGGNLPDSHSARPPFLPAPCGPPACPSDLKPALAAARGNPSSSGGPTDRG